MGRIAFTTNSSCTRIYISPTSTILDKHIRPQTYGLLDLGISDFAKYISTYARPPKSSSWRMPITLRQKTKDTAALLRALLGESKYILTQRPRTHLLPRTVVLFLLMSSPLTLFNFFHGEKKWRQKSAISKNKSKAESYFNSIFATAFLRD